MAALNRYIFQKIWLPVHQPILCTKDAGGLFKKVLWSCLLLIDLSGSLKILDNISAMLSTKKYDTDPSVSFSSRKNLWYSKKLH